MTIVGGAWSVRTTGAADHLEKVFVEERKEMSSITTYYGNNLSPPRRGGRPARRGTGEEEDLWKIYNGWKYMEQQIAANWCSPGN